MCPLKPWQVKTPYHKRDDDGFSVFTTHEKTNKVTQRLQELDENNNDTKTNIFYEYSKTLGKVAKYDDSDKNKDRNYLGLVGDETVKTVLQMLKKESKSMTISIN